MKNLDELAPPMLLVYGEIYVGREWTELGLSLQGEGGMCEPLEVNCRKISAFTLFDDV